MYNARPEIFEVLDELFFPSLIRNGSANKQLILLDDASPLEHETQRLIAKYLPDVKTRFGDFRFIRNAANLGFAGSYNKGMRMAEGANLVVTNDDVYFPVGSLDGLVSVLKEPQAGIVGPVTNYAFSYQNTRLFGRLKDHSAAELQRIERFAQELKTKVGKKVIPVDRLTGFCLAISGDLHRQIGGFDDGFTFGAFEDADYCIRARKVGWQVLLDASTFIEHGGAQGGSLSFKQEWLKTRRHWLMNAIRFARKHKMRLRQITGLFVDTFIQHQFDRHTVTPHLKRFLRADSACD
jgi:GT2 family glycosyltransferase